MDSEFCKKCSKLKEEKIIPKSSCKILRNIFAKKTIFPKQTEFCIQSMYPVIIEEDKAYAPRESRCFWKCISNQSFDDLTGESARRNDETVNYKSELILQLVTPSSNIRDYIPPHISDLKSEAAKKFVRKMYFVQTSKDPVDELQSYINSEFGTNMCNKNNDMTDQKMNLLLYRINERKFIKLRIINNTPYKQCDGIEEKMVKSGKTTYTKVWKNKEYTVNGKKIKGQHWEPILEPENVISKLYGDFSMLKFVKELYLEMEFIKEVPVGLLEMPNLKVLDITFCNLIKNFNIPTDKQLIHLLEFLPPINIEKIESALYYMPNLETLYMHKCVRIENLSDSAFEKTEKIKLISLPPNLKEFPQQIRNIKTLRILNMGACVYIQHLPSFIEKMPLQKLILPPNLEAISGNIINNENFRELDMSQCVKITTLPKFINTENQLSFVLPPGLTEFPHELKELKNLQCLDMRHCLLIKKVYIRSIEKMKKLRTLYLPPNLIDRSLDLRYLKFIKGLETY
jgi:hypothetical protein